MSRPRQVPERPKADGFVSAFNGPPYGVVGPLPVVRNPTHGPGSGTSGGDVSHVTLDYLVGRARQEVSITTSVYRRETLQDVQVLVVNLLLHSLWASRPLRKFPIDIRIERQKLKLLVDGQEGAFTAYSAGPVMRAVAELGHVVVTVEGPVDLVPRLRLAPLRPGALERWLSR